MRLFSLSAQSILDRLQFPSITTSNQITILAIIQPIITYQVEFVIDLLRLLGFA
jgi:hypothetical protein